MNPTRRDATWVFGYGSLVSPVSLARTIGRHPADGEMLAASLDGYGRRWNYGSLRQRADWHGPHGPVRQGVVVSLGLEALDTGRCNGAVVRVTEDELALLDIRESDYERTDVTDRIAVDGDVGDGRIVTYVPRPSAIERYRSARDGRRAAIRRSYVDLVADAFAALGGGHLDEYRTGTPAPDVPIVDFS